MNDILPSNEDLMASTPLAWILLNDMKNENQKKLEFDTHRFLIDVYADESDDIVCRKSAQVGFSVFAILKTLWTAKYRKLNVIYALPTKNVVNDFVRPKVNPLIEGNPAIADSVTDDSVSLKKVGDRFVYFKGGFSDREAISISGDLLVIDEYDRMPSMSVVNTFDSRLQASDHPMRWRFSNPSQVGFGVDGLYNDSNQYHWVVTCDHCKHEYFIDWEPDEIGKCHYVDRDRQVFACGKCKEEISDEARRMGRWIARYPERKRHGYWISQMMAPWVTAARIIEQYEESNIEFFHHFVLGKAYTPTDMIVDRAAILRATAPSTIPKTQVAMGVDQDAGGCYYILGTPSGIFAHGYVKSWEEIEQLKLMYNATVVVDPNPYSTMPKIMAAKYPDWYLCYFKEQEGIHTINWKPGQIVNADRTKILDIIANEIVGAKLLFREHPYALEDVIKHWNNLYRATEEKDDGRSKSTWFKKDDHQSDYPFAMAYFRIALSRVMGGTSTLIEPNDTFNTTLTTMSVENGKSRGSFGDVLSETFAEME